ncbi:MAG: hypothetical protein FWG58_05285 [Methanomassiliicoccaceae archaeon]|nr:hypothetical protein [Methanomassiliicoccaceae archaeon]
MTRLTIAEKIILHLSRYELFPDDEEFNISWDLTQDGIAASLRITRAHSSIELKKLREKGKVTERQTHIKSGGVKRKSYALTSIGMDEAKHLRAMAEKEGIDIMPMLDMKRCDPRTVLESAGEENRDAFGLACVLRRPVPRGDLPNTTKPVIPTDINGMTAMSDVVKRSVLSVAGKEEIRNWHSSAADYWLDNGNIQERLFHLVSAGRMNDACRMIVNEKERLLYNISDDLFLTLAKIDGIPERYVADVLPVIITVAIGCGDIETAGSLISVLKERDNELGLLYSADLEMRKGDHSKALDIVRSLGKSNRFEVRLRMAGAIGHLGNKNEAMDLLYAMKDEIVASGTVDGLDRVYIGMSDVSLISKDPDSSVRYLMKALGVTSDEGKKIIYALLSASYDAAGIKDKSEEYAAKAR